MISAILQKLRYVQMKQRRFVHTNWSRPALTGLLTLLVAFLLSACVTSFTVSEDESQAVTVPVTPAVTLTSFGGPVEVVTGEEGSVRAELTRRSSNPDAAAAQAEVDAIQMAISQSGPDVAVTITYDGPRDDETGAEAAVMLSVPPGSTVRAETATGTVTFDEQVVDATGVVGTGSVTFTLLEEEPFSLRAEAENGELLSDLEALSSRPLFGVYEGGVGEEAGRHMSAVIGQGRVYLRLNE